MIASLLLAGAFYIGPATPTTAVWAVGEKVYICPSGVKPPNTKCVIQAQDTRPPASRP